MPANIGQHNDKKVLFIGPAFWESVYLSIDYEDPFRIDGYRIYKAETIEDAMDIVSKNAIDVVIVFEDGNRYAKKMDVKPKIWSQQVIFWFVNGVGERPKNFPFEEHIQKSPEQSYLDVWDMTHGRMGMYFRGNVGSDIDPRIGKWMSCESTSEVRFLYQKELGQTTIFGEKENLRILALSLKAWGYQEIVP